MSLTVPVIRKGRPRASRPVIRPRRDSHSHNHAKWQPKQLREVVPQTDRLNDEGLDLVKHMLLYTPQARITAKDALEHPYFNGLNLDTVGKIPLPF